MISVIVFLICITVYSLSFGFAIYQVVFKGKVNYFLFPLAIILAIYLTLQITAYQTFGSIELPVAMKYFKELTLFLAIVSWFFYKKNSLQYQFSLYKIDYVALVFVGFVFLFYILPIGEASFADKTIYFKNILVLAVMYFMGRNMSLSKKETLDLCHLILVISVLAFPVVLIEKIFNTHFQQIIGYTEYIIANDSDPTGAYGLTYTFQASGGTKRFAAFFTTPLELATFSVLAISVSIILFNTQRKLRGVYFATGFLALLSLIFSYSRAPLAGFFLMALYIAMLFGYWRYILLAFAFAIAVVVLPLIFGGDVLRFFIIDTFTLADPSSVGHIAEWLIGIESMISNPLGIGLAMSGNAGGIDEALQVGGENQFIVFGVQLGWLGMIIYMYLVYLSIKVPQKAFRNAPNSTAQIFPFIATTFKVAFLVSLMTANAEIYGFVSYFSWWMVGYSVQYLRQPIDSANLQLQGAA